MLNKYVSSVFKNHVYVDCLFLSCSIGSRTLIKFLLEKGLKPDVLSRRQFTALHLAAYRVCLMKPQNATQLIVSVLPISWQNIIWKFLLVINFLCYIKNITILNLKYLRHIFSIESLHSLIHISMTLISYGASIYHWYCWCLFYWYRGMRSVSSVYWKVRTRTLTWLGTVASQPYT